MLYSLARGAGTRDAGAALATMIVAMSLTLGATATPAHALDEKAVSEVTEAYESAGDAPGMSLDASIEPFGSRAASGGRAPGAGVEVQFGDAVAVTTPADPASGVAVGTGPDAIGIVPDRAAASNEKTETKTGVSVYGGSGAVSTVVEPTVTGARISTVALRDSGADH